VLRALLFDFDGLVVDTETASFASWQALYRSYGHELTLDRWSAAVGTLGGFDPVVHLRELGAEVDDAALERRLAHDLELCDVEDLRPGVLATIEEAERRGIAVAIVSSASRRWVDRHLARLERAHHFADIVTADGDLARAKPLPVLYLEALERLGIAAGEAIAFEDSPHGIAAAKAAGIACVAVPNGVTRSFAGLDEADVVVDSLADVPFEQLLELVANP
jgi:HAD superfamily hydrolase (TIGR01509 family)